MAKSRKGNPANLFGRARTNERLRGSHELSENRTEQASHVPKMALNHPSSFLFPATKSMILSSINDNNFSLFVPSLKLNLTAEDDKWPGQSRGDHT